MEKTIHQSEQLNFWHLGSIAGASGLITSFMSGGQLSKQYGSENVIGSILIGNLILWFIGMAFISMSRLHRENAIVNIKEHLGKKSAIFGAICLILILVGWFLMQLKSTNILIGKTLQIDESNPLDINLRIGAILGLAAALLGVGGLRVIKWVFSISLFLILGLIIFLLFQIELPVHFSLKFSFLGILSSILFSFAGIVNLPSFYKHARSKADAYLGLTLWFVFTAFLEITSIWLSKSNLFLFNSNILKAHNIFYAYFLVGFIVITVLANLISNIFFSSACWEILYKNFKGPKKFAILGLLYTSLYLFIQVSGPMQYLFNLANYFVGALAGVLLMNYLGVLVVQQKKHVLVRYFSIAAWVVGCVVSVFIEYKRTNHPAETLLVTLSSTSIFFLWIFFLYETLWSGRKILHRRFYSS